MHFSSINYIFYITVIQVSLISTRANTLASLLRKYSSTISKRTRQRILGRYMITWAADCNIYHFDPHKSLPFRATGIFIWLLKHLTCEYFAYNKINLSIVDE